MFNYVMYDQVVLEQLNIYMSNLNSIFIVSVACSEMVGVFTNLFYMFVVRVNVLSDQCRHLELLPKLAPLATRFFRKEEAVKYKFYPVSERLEVLYP